MTQTPRINRRHLSGFSLMELAIALAILAVLTGGVLKGRSLLADAKVQSTATELANLQTAVMAFESRYKALPGDFSGASAAGLGSAGDGDGSIDSAEEEGALWQHLTAAGFIQGSFDGQKTAGYLQCASNSCLSSPLGGTFVITHRLNEESLGTELNSSLGDPQPAKVVAQLDRQMDDGNPLTGTLRVSSTASENCVTDDNFWNEADNPVCSALYRLR